MGWTMLYLFFFLKLPILAACYIVWWAVRQGTDTEDVPASDGGTPLRPRPHPRRPRHPRPPRRGGPHAAGLSMAPPPRIRSVTAAGRARELEH
jgi:hypothetical protein